ncbi:MAG: hypothetical protein RR619_02365, partial [Raoultibacter sp.]
MTRLEAAVALDSQMSLLREAANKYEAGVTELDSIGAIASKLDAGSLAECASRFGIQASELLEYISSSSAVCHIDINELHRFYPNGYRNAWPLNFCLNDNGGLHGLVRRDDHVLMVVGDAFFTGTTNWQGDSRSIIMKNDATFDYGAITFSDRYGDVFFAKVFDKDVAIYVNAQYKLTIYEYTENGAFTLVAQETQANSSYNHVSSVIENNDGTITIIRCPMNSGTASSNYLMAKVTLLDENLAMEEVGLIASADFSNRNIVFTFKHDGGIYGFADYAGRPPSSGPYKPELYKLDLSTPSAELIKNDFNIQYCS